MRDVRDTIDSALERAGEKLVRAQRVFFLNLAYFTIVILSHLYLRLRRRTSYTEGYYSEPEGIVCGEIEEYLNQY